jgi:hypothetical protein
MLAVKVNVHERPLVVAVQPGEPLASGTVMGVPVLCAIVSEFVAGET